MLPFSSYDTVLALKCVQSSGNDRYKRKIKLIISIKETWSYVFVNCLTLPKMTHYFSGCDSDSFIRRSGNRTIDAV